MSYDVYTLVFYGCLGAMLGLGLIINIVAIIKGWTVGKALGLVVLWIVVCLVVFGGVSYYYMENAPETEQVGVLISSIIR